MKKEKVIGIGVLLGIIILAVIVVVVAGNQRKNKKKTETEKACTEKKNRFECNAFDIFFTGMCLWKIFS